MMRATVDDPEMARGVGINVQLISMIVFALGAFLAAVAGVVAGGFVGVYPAPTLKFYRTLLCRHRRRYGKSQRRSDWQPHGRASRQLRQSAFS